MVKDLLQSVGKITTYMGFIVVFMLFVDEISVIPYFFGLLTSFVSLFLSFFCYVGVSAEAIGVADTLISTMVYAYLIFFIYSVLK